MFESQSGSRYVRDIETIVDTSSQHACGAGHRSGASARQLRRAPHAEAGLPQPQDRPHPRSARQDHHLRSDLRPAGAADTRPSGGRRLGRSRHRLVRPPSSRRCRATPADPSSGGGLQTFDYFMLQLLNREINVLKHLRTSKFVHPQRLYEELLRLSGELWTFSPSRLPPEYAEYDQDNLAAVFDPLLADIQRLLAIDVGRAVHLESRAARAQRLCRRRDRPYPVPQRHLRGRGGCRHAADADPAAIPGAVQDRPQHQDERNRSGAFARHRDRPPADTAAADPGGVGPRLFLPR